MKIKTAAESENQDSESSKKPDWEKIRETIKYLESQGATVVNQHKKPRTVQVPEYPGLKILAAVDCLVNHGGFTRLYSEDERHRLTMIQIGYNVADI